jgi:hypothetical protein
MGPGGIHLEKGDRVTRLRLLLIVSATVVIVCPVKPAAAQLSVQSPATVDGLISGRLATVEPARRRITLVPIGESRMVELEVAERAPIVHADRGLTLAELVVEVGSLVQVDYRKEGARWIAERVTIQVAAG